MTRNQRRQLIAEWSARDKLGCFWCGGGFANHKDRQAEIEHFFPISRGGSSRDFNTVVAHGRCNRAHGNRLPTEQHMRRFFNIRPNQAKAAMLHFAGAIVLGLAV